MGVILTFLEVTREKLVGDLLISPISSRVNELFNSNFVVFRKCSNNSLEFNLILWKLIMALPFLFTLSQEQQIVDTAEIIYARVTLPCLAPKVFFFSLLQFCFYFLFINFFNLFILFVCIYIKSIYIKSIYGQKPFHFFLKTHQHSSTQHSNYGDNEMGHFY